MENLTNKDLSVLDLTTVNLNELDINRKEIYIHYYDCLEIIIQITSLLIPKLDEEFTYLQPVLLDYSFDKETLYNFRKLYKRLTKQIKGFEKRVIQEKINNPNIYNLNPQRILCISNGIKSLSNRIVDLLENVSDNDMSNVIKSIFSESQSFCTFISHYTRQCRLDKKLFNQKDEIIDFIINKNALYIEKNENKAKEALKRLTRKRTEYEIVVRDKEYLPKKIKKELNLFLHIINTFNQSTNSNDESKNMHLSIISDKYNTIIDGIQEYILEIQKIIITFLLQIHDEFGPLLLDCDISSIGFKEYVSTANMLKELYEDVEATTRYKVRTIIQEYIIIITAIAKLYPEFTYIHEYCNTIRYLQDIIMRVDLIKENLTTIYEKQKRNLESCKVLPHNLNFYDEYKIDDLRKKRELF